MNCTIYTNQGNVTLLQYKLEYSHACSKIRVQNPMGWEVLHLTQRWKGMRRAQLSEGHSTLQSSGGAQVLAFIFSPRTVSWTLTTLILPYWPTSTSPKCWRFMKVIATNTTSWKSSQAYRRVEGIVMVCGRCEGFIPCNPFLWPYL
jgi:hypothetical protein